MSINVRYVVIKDGINWAVLDLSTMRKHSSWKRLIDARNQMLDLQKASN